jgi:hypothetical protein
MKLEQVIDANFSAAMSKLAANNLPIKTAFKLKKIVADLDEEISRYHETRKEYLGKYAERGEDGEILQNSQGGAVLTDENQELFLQELSELLQLEVEVETVKVDELGDISMTPLELVYLDGLVVL